MKGDSASAKPIRCLHIASGDLWAGAEVQIYNLVSRLHGMPGVAPYVVLLNEGALAERLREVGVDVTILDEQRLSGWAIFQKLRNLIHRTGIDIVHTHRHKEHILGALAARMTNTPSIRTVHGRSEHKAALTDLRRRVLQTLDRFTARFLQKDVIAVSEILGTELAEQFPQGKIVVIPNGVDLTHISRLPQPPAREALGARPMEIAVVGRLAPVKRLDLVLDITAELENRHPGTFRFFIYGDGPLRGAMQARAAQLLPGEVVTFAGFRSDVLERLNEHDALLITSDHEGLPTNLLEALALGKPVVARKVGEIPLVLGQELTDYSVDADTAGPFAAALEVLHHRLVNKSVNPDLARKRAALYSADASASQYGHLYEKIAGRTSA